MDSHHAVFILRFIIQHLRTNTLFRPPSRLYCFQSSLFDSLLDLLESYGILWCTAATHAIVKIRCVLLDLGTELATVET